MMKKKRIFLTGGSGFVGKNLIPILMDKGFDVFALCRSHKSAAIVEALGASVVMDDLCSLSNNTEEALKQSEYVLHSAAYMNFTYDPKPYYAINVEATRKLVELAQECGIQKFIYISAAPVVPGSPIVNLTEDMAQNGLPSELYPKTKALGENIVLEANHDTFQTISLRPPAIWGPNNHHYDELFENVKDGKWRWIGGGNHVLSTIHVKNLANAILAALNSPLGGEAYFVTDGERRPMKSFFKALLNAEGLEPGDKELPRSVAILAAHLIGGIWKLFGLKSRPPVAPLMIRLMGTEFSVSDQKARKELGYKNAITIDEGLAQIKL